MGVVHTMVRPGKGAKPKMGDRVTMHYECRLASSGRIVDSSKLKGRAAEFQIGTGRVIEGWDKGVVEMQEGEEAILKVTSDYAYGTSGRPPSIPPNADLDFTCELLAINESMVAASMRVKIEKIALELEDQMVAEAHAEARREAAGEGPELPDEGGARESKKKRKREKADKPEKKHKKSSKRRRDSSSDSESDSSSGSSSSSDSSREKRKRRKEKKHKKSSKKKDKKSCKH